MLIVQISMRRRGRRAASAAALNQGSWHRDYSRDVAAGAAVSGPRSGYAVLWGCCAPGGARTAHQLVGAVAARLRTRHGAPRGAPAVTLQQRERR
jgi:hypothetical protein